MAITVRKATDRIEIQIGDAKFKMAPLSQDQKIKLMEYVSMDGGSRVENLAKMSFLSVKFVLKEASGLVYADGSEYKLELDNDGLVSDKSISELMNTEISQELLTCSQSFMQGIPKEIINPMTKKKFENVEIISELSNSKKKPVAG